MQEACCTLADPLGACRPPQLPDDVVNGSDASPCLHGMLLPFGSMDAHHNTANQLLLTPKLGYSLGDGSDPCRSGNMHGWSESSTVATNSGHGGPAAPSTSPAAYLCTMDGFHSAHIMCHACCPAARRSG